MFSRFKQHVLAAAVATVGTLAVGWAQAVTPFQQDVGTAINNGLAFVKANGGFVGNAGWATGLETLALLEKRASGNPSDPPQGYGGASSTDQTDMRTAVSYLVRLARPSGFYAYGDGAALSALTEYLATGGPEACASPCSPAQLAATPTELQNLPDTVLGTVNYLVDITLKAQRTAANLQPNDYQQGYWHYSGPDDTDSSTTQYAALGLAAAQAFYNNPTFGDPGNRLPGIAAALSLARQGYVLNAEQGSQDPACDPGFTYTSPNPSSYPAGFVPNPQIILNNGGAATKALVPTDPQAYGHGYHSSPEGYPPSLQQTASGLFVQALGGANINDPMVQGYMRWVNDHYRYTDNGSLNGAGQLGWGYDSSYFYYLWASFKGIEFLTQQGVTPNPGNLTTTSYGTTSGTTAPVCTDRQVHLDPAVVSRVPTFGPGGAGYYSAETKSLYFDYAYMILSYQCAPTSNGADFSCNSSSGIGSTNPGSWAEWDRVAYALLVLQRATGVLAPSATLVASASSASVGVPVTLTWGSQNANSCAASGGTSGDGWTGSNLGTSGSLPVKEAVAGTYTYTITCSAGSQSAQAQVQVTFTGAMMCDVSGPNGTPDGEVSLYDINVLRSFLNQLTQPNGPAPAAGDPMGAGKITAQDIRACTLRCTNTNCAN